MECVVQNQKLHLRADKSIYWSTQKALLIADPHFGKPESFRALGVPAPGNTTEQTLARIDHAVHQTNAEQLFILGDFWHARNGITEELFAEITNWRERNCQLKIKLVLGNHDRKSGGFPTIWNFEIFSSTHQITPFTLSHYPDAVSDSYILAGHLHPAIRLSGKGKQSLRLPCFWFGEHAGVLPAFGGYTGNADISPLPNDQVFVIADDEVIPV